LFMDAPKAGTVSNITSKPIVNVVFVINFMIFQPQYTVS
jgi:hypothetical protein